MAGPVRNLLLAAASVGLALVVFEAGLRAVGFRFSFAPERVEFGWPNPQYLTERFDRDPDLFWVTRDYAEKLENLAAERPDIVFAGDSTTELGRYPADFLRRASERTPTHPLRGGPVGVSGWSSYQGVRQLERDLLPLRPRFVTFLYGWNDHWVGFALEDADVHAITTSPIARLEGLRLADLLVRTHYALRSRGRAIVDRRVPPDAFASNLRALVALSRDAGIVPVLLTAPTSHRRGREPAYLGQRWLRDLSELVPLHRRYVAVVREVADRVGAPLCDLAAHFAAQPPARLDDELFMSDGIHLTPAGDDELAATLVACFESDAELRTLWDSR